MRSTHVLFAGLLMVCTGCITIDSQQARLGHVTFTDLEVAPGAPAAERVQAATRASQIELNLDAEKRDAAETFLQSPVGSPVVVATQAAWWLEDLAPLVASDSEAAQHLQKHIDHRDAALQKDMLFNGASGVASVAAIGGLAGLGWLLFLDGGDPAFYLTLGVAGGGAALSVSGFLGWYFAVADDHVEARNEKIEFVTKYHQGVAKKYNVKIEPDATDPSRLRIEATE